MTRNSNFEMRACSLPPETVSVTGGCSPLKVCPDHGQKKFIACQQHQDANRGSLVLSEDIVKGCGDVNLCSPNSTGPANRPTKHSPSDSGSAFTDEDSGCQLYHVGAKCRMGRAYSVTTLDSPSVQSFGNKDEFLGAMTEDLAEWFCRLYPETTKDLDPENFFDRISDGVLLCHHATELHRVLEREFPVTRENSERRLQGIQIGGIRPFLPTSPPNFQTRGFNVAGSAGVSFWSRDNIANFIHWCRAMRLPDSILFETEDLVSRKNLRSVIVCLLELARLGGRVGMEVPEIIYLEKEIDNEIAMGDRALLVDCGTDAPADTVRCGWSGGTEEGDTVSVGGSSTASTNESVSRIPHLFQMRSENRNTKAALLREQKIKKELERRRACRQETRQTEEEEQHKKPRYNRPVIDMRTLDEIVREKLAQCTCEQTFPMIRLSEGRYLFGDKSTQIFIRILRSHVMVRVGGGWDTLDHFLQKYDECRKVQSPTALTCGQRRRDFRKASQPNSSEATALDTSNPDLGLPDSLLGEGNLRVTRKGREVIHTEKKITHQKPFKCQAPFHSPVSTIDIKHNEMHISRSSSIDDFTQIGQLEETKTEARNCITLPMTLCVTTPGEDHGKVPPPKASPPGPNTECLDLGRLPPTSSIEGVHDVPIIDQVKSIYEEKPKEKETKEKKTTAPYIVAPPKAFEKVAAAFPTYRRSAVAATIKAYKHPHTSTVSSQFSSSTNNLTSVGTASPNSTMGRRSASTLSLANNSPTKKVIRPTPSSTRPGRAPNSPKTKKRAQSISNLSVASPAKEPTKNWPRSNVFERLAADAKVRRTSASQLVSPPTSPIKKQPDYTKAPAVATRRPGSMTMIKRSATLKSSSTGTEEFKVPIPFKSLNGGSRSRRPSVARLPAEGSRIPCPAKNRSQSVATNLYLEGR